jgi:hypothetical protein
LSFALIRVIREPLGELRNVPRLRVGLFVCLVCFVVVYLGASLQLRCEQLQTRNGAITKLLSARALPRDQQDTDHDGDGGSSQPAGRHVTGFVHAPTRLHQLVLVLTQHKQ